MDERESCGLCGSSLASVERVDDRADPLPPPTRPIPKILPGERSNIEALLLALTIGGGLTIGGLLVATNATVGYYNTIIGVQLTIFGLIIIMAVTLGTVGGLFSGWRGWYLEVIRRRWFRDEPREYAENPDEQQND